MRILVACEESQVVTTEFRKLGHDAYSCDIEPCSGGHPEWHLQQDVFPLLQENWDMIIAFPPCTFLSNVGAKHLFRGHRLNNERYAKGVRGKNFFMSFYNAKCARIAIENPTPSSIYKLPLCDQIIQPWQFGHPFSKRTQLWLKGLPKLIPTNIIYDHTNCLGSTWFNAGGGKVRQKNRSKFWPGIARAMATQWTPPYTLISQKRLF